jgi:hypothetical protein
MSVSRREFLFAVPAASAALAFLPASAAVAAHVPALRAAVRNALGESAGRGQPVVSFHLDQPYFDITGLEKPYVPPAGMRSAEPLAALSDEALSRFYGFI